jgi:hypothetical protein|uniref:Uncharacterized protein n=1 Tax=viral metagenome TaxID=1070528 RepID=A0A6C0JB07_9ZZZZ|tara:strand:+ start:747 stop:1259 length:513 start_codon:yes stop_codon:yes gene_type:complete
MSQTDTVPEESLHKLNDAWTLWAHLPHDTDWSLKSYKEISTFHHAEHFIALNEMIPEPMIKNCMLFLMRKGITPLWEDSRNRKGGCFSYKVLNKHVCDAWKKICYLIAGESITDNGNLHINGCTISPKRNFCIIKVWTANCDVQNPRDVILKDTAISSQGCLFKTHSVQY